MTHVQPHSGPQLLPACPPTPTHPSTPTTPCCYILQDEVAKLTKAIEDRHAAELAALDAGGPSPSAPPTAPATTSSSAPAAPSRKAAAAAGGGGGAAAAGAAAAEAARKFVKDLSVEDGAAGGGSRVSAAGWFACTKHTMLQAGLLAQTSNSRMAACK
jgi:hypothetical protein